MLLYAVDIVLLAPSVSELEKLLFVCETELRWMDMVINTKNPRACALDLDIRLTVIT